MDQQNQIQKNLIEELGLSDLSQEKKDQLIIKMTEVIIKRMFLETMEKLNDEDKEIYGKMVDDQAIATSVFSILAALMVMNCGGKMKGKKQMKLLVVLVGLVSLVLSSLQLHEEVA